MTLRNKRFILVLCLGLFLFPAGARAADDEESKVVKAADAIFEGLPSAVKAAVDFKKMTPEQRVDFLITGVESKIQDGVADKFKEEMFDKVKDMTKEAIRANMFLETAVPQIKHAYAMGQAFDWSKIDSQLASQVDTRMNALSAGVKTIQIGWGAYQAYSTGNWSAAARSVGGEITAMMAEAVVPGYGYIKIGAEMVEFLGNYVLDYATDTAVEGMLDSMFGMKSNPQGLAQWLINKSPQDIMKDINDKFDWGAGYGYVYKGQGTDSGDAAIKSQLQGVLVGLRGELLAKKKEQEQKEQRIKNDIDNYLQRYRASQDRVKAVADKAKADVDKIMAPVRDFKRKVSALRKADVKEDLAEIERQKGDVDAGGTVTYVPLNRKSLIGDLHSLYSEVKDSTGSGFDYEAINRMMSAYNKRRAEEVKAFGQANQENFYRVRKAVYDQYEPPMTALYNTIQNTDHGPARERLEAQLAQLGAAMSAQMQKVHESFGENQKMMALEMAAFVEEEQVVKLEAQERTDILSEKIEAGMRKISAGILAAQRERDAALAVWSREVSEKLSAPQLFSNQSTVVGVETCAGICGPAGTIKDGQLDLYAPGSLAAGREEALSALEKIKEDLTKVGALSDQEKAIISVYQTKIQSLRNDFESLLPPDLRYISSAGSPEHVKTLDERVAKSGIGAAEDEDWRVTPPSFVQFRIETAQTPTVGVPVRYYGQWLQQLETVKAQRIKHFQDAVKNLQENISVIDFYADLDRIAVVIKAIGANLDKVLAPYIWADWNFRTKDGKIDPLVLASESDGAKKLAEMKEAWAKYKTQVEKMRKNVNAYGKGLKYIGFDQSPDKAIAMLAKYEAIPGIIAAGEKRMAQTEKERADSKKMVEEELVKLREDFKSMQNPKNEMSYTVTLRNLRTTFDQLFKILHLDMMRGAFKDDYIKLRDEVEAYAKKHDEQAKANLEAYQRQQEAESAAAREKARQEAERKNNESLKNANPAEFYGYRFVDVRINTYPVAGASGDVIVTRDKLVQGQIQISAQLSHVDHVKTLLFSEDGGRTWKEIPVNANINYSVIPIPNKIYNLFIQIKTDDFQTVNLKLIPQANGVIYKDEDFSQQVVAAVKAMADAYERQDLGGFSDLISRDYLGNKTFLQEGVRFDFDMFLDISLKIYINRVEQRADRFVVETKWDKSQTPRTTGQTQKTSGKTTMMFVLEDGGLKIQNLRGDLIYATLSPEIAQASGLPAATVDEIRTAKNDRSPVQPGAGITDDSGGVSSSSSSSLTVKTNSLVDIYPGLGDESIDYSSDTVVALTAGDVGFEVNSFWAQTGAGIKKVATSFAATTDASGVTTANVNDFGFSAGDVYIFLTTEGYYGKMEILSWTEEDTNADLSADKSTVQFKYVVQTNGTTDVSTN